MDIQKEDKVFCVRLLNEVLDMYCDEGDLKKIFRLGKVEDEKGTRYDEKDVAIKCHLLISSS